MTQLRGERTVAGNGKESVFKASEVEKVLDCGSMDSNGMDDECGARAAVRGKRGYVVDSRALNLWGPRTSNVRSALYTGFWFWSRWGK